MRRDSSKLIVLHLRVWLLIGILVGVSSLAACGQTATIGPAETAPDAEVLVIDAPYRPDVDIPPQVTDPAGRVSLAPLLEEAPTADGAISKDDLEEIYLRVTVPPLPFNIQTITDTQGLSDSYIDQMSFVLVGPASSAGIAFDFPETLSVDAFHDETVIHGLLEGVIAFEDGSTADILMTLAIIPERERGRFNLNISSHNNTPRVILPFGELEFTPELSELVAPEE
jgi:hypothetical protein